MTKTHGEWLTNMRDPVRFGYGHVAVFIGESEEQAMERRQQFLQGKVIGPPKATEKYTVEYLAALGWVGIYAPHSEEA